MEQEPFGSSSSFSWMERGGRSLVLRKGYERILLDMGIAEGTDAVLARAKGKVRALRGRADVFCFPLPGGMGNVVLRRYRRGGLLRHFLRDRFFRSRRPFRELSIVEEAVQAGLNAPQVLGVVLEKEVFFLHRGAILLRQIPGSLDLQAYFQADPKQRMSYGRRSQVIRNVAREIRKMHEAGFYHRDLNLKNILVQEGGRVFVIDFDGSRRYNPLSVRLCTKNLFRFNRSVEKAKREGLGIYNSDRLRFFKEYTRSQWNLSQELLGRFKRFGLHLFWHRLGWSLSGTLRRVFLKKSLPRTGQGRSNG